MRRRLGVAAAILTLAALLGGCGIPLSRGAQPVAARNLPPELNGGTSAATTTTTTTPPAPQHAAHLEIYLVAPDGLQLVAARRPWEQRVTPLVALELLALGPNSIESKRGIQTFLGAAPHFEISITKAKIAKIKLDVSTFGELFGSNLYMPLAQIVYTLMEDFPYLKGIDFYLGGQLFNYTPSGGSSLAPVTERTYAAVAPRRGRSSSGS